MDKKYTLEDLRSVMKQLLSENGCPWDKAQTHESLKRYFIEETYEVIDAIDNKDKANLCEELGDVLFQVVFHSELAQKERLFNLDDVIDGITKKMILRHPHVFSNTDLSTDKINTITTINTINTSWESIKKQEKGYKSNIEIIKSVPHSLPALIRCDKTISKALKTGADTLSYEDLLQENHNLSTSLNEAENMNNKEKMELIGKFLLNLSKISYFLQINAEFSLTNALETYINKLEDIETAKTTVGKISEDTNFEVAEVNRN